MDRVRAVSGTRLPGFLGCEAEDRGKPRRETVEDLVHDGAASTAFDGVERVTIETVLADLEIEGRQVAVTQGMKLGKDAVEIIGLGEGTDPLVDLCKAMQDPALQRRHLVMQHGFAVGVAVKRAEKVAKRIAETAIAVRRALDDLRPDAKVIVIVGTDHPQAEDVGAVLVHDLLRRDDIAQRLRHLASLLVEHETVRQDTLVGRLAARGAGLQKRGMEPAAMLVGTLEIEIGRAFEISPFLQHEGMGGAGITKYAFHFWGRPTKK